MSHPTDEAVLRAAVRADPTDRAPRSALADWLQETGRDDEAAEHKRVVMAESSSMMYLFRDSEGYVVLSDLPPVAADSAISPDRDSVQVAIFDEGCAILGIEPPGAGQILRAHFVLDQVEVGEVVVTFRPLEKKPARRGRGK